MSCDLACQTKIIIDGSNTGGLMQSANDGLKHFFNNGGELHDAESLHKELIALEEMAIKFQKSVIKAIKYSGQLPAYLKS